MQPLRLASVLRTSGVVRAASCFKELQSLFHELLVVLEDAPMPSVLIEDELGVRKAVRQIDRVAAGHRSEERRVGKECRL